MAISRLYSGIIDSAPVADISSIPLPPTDCEKDLLLCYTGEFNSMDGPVKVTLADLNRVCDKYNLKLLKMMESGGIDRKHCAPIQLDHSSSATMTVGRVTGILSVRDHTLPDGKKVKGLFGRGTIIGAENVEKACDGRWSNLSIGADFEEGDLSELTVTPFPAAEHASMLSKGNLSEGGKMDPKEKLKKYLMDEKKMSAEDADKKLAEADDSEMSRMSGEMDEHEKKLSEVNADPTKMADGNADPTKMSDDEKKKKDEEERLQAEEDEKKKALNDGKVADPTRMAAMKSKIVSLAKGFKEKTNEIRLAARQAGINTRLTALRKDGKLSPAELKGIKSEEIARLSDEAVEVLFGTLSNLSKKLDTSVAGDTRAESIEKVRHSYRLQRLELETRLNMPMKRKEAMERLSKLAVEESEAIKAAESGQMSVQKEAHYDMTYARLSKMIDDGDKEGAKVALKAFIDESSKVTLVGQESGVDDKKMSGLASDVQKLHNQYKEIVSLVAGEYGITADELE